MKTKIAIACLTLVTAAFSLDEYLPMAEGKYEIDVAGNAILSRGRYNADGDIVGSTGKAGMIPLQFKYGIVSGLDAELAWTFNTLGAGYTGGTAASGFSQPELAVKYSLKDLNPDAEALRYTAVFLNVGIPFATGDMAEGKVNFSPGVVYGQNIGEFQAVGLAAYQINTEEGVDGKFTLFLKPGYMFNGASAGYLGVKYEMQGDANLLTVLPGTTMTFSDAISLEANVPVTVLGKSNTAAYGLLLALYYTF